MITFAMPTETTPVIDPPQGQWTLTAWEQLPHHVGDHYEVIDGMLYVSGIPSIFHQWIACRLAEYVGLPAEDKQLGYYAIARVGVIMAGCSPVQPDFSIVLKSRVSIIHDRYIFGAPDLIVEVSSPDHIIYDMQVKLNAYGRAGVPEYAIIDPKTRTVSLYSLIQPQTYGQPQIFGNTDQVNFACLPGITFHANELFDGTPDSSL